VSHTAPFTPPLGVCHVVTCYCFMAFVGMLLCSFYSHRIFVYYVCMCVCIYICMYAHYHKLCVNSFVRRSRVGPSYLARVRVLSARGAQTVKLASRVSRRELRTVLFSVLVIERSSCISCIFNFHVWRSTFTFIAVIIVIYIYKISSRLFDIIIDGARKVVGATTRSVTVI
jgi:hypothetical protein